MLPWIWARVLQEQGLAFSAGYPEGHLVLIHPPLWCLQRSPPYLREWCGTVTPWLWWLCLCKGLTSREAGWEVYRTLYYFYNFSGSPTLVQNKWKNGKLVFIMEAFRRNPCFSQKCSSKQTSPNLLTKVGGWTRLRKTSGMWAGAACRASEGAEEGVEGPGDTWQDWSLLFCK